MDAPKTTTFRLDEQTLAEMDRLAAELGRKVGLPPLSRADVLRAALNRLSQEFPRKIPQRA